jgi:hypothetical protein
MIDRSTMTAALVLAGVVASAAPALAADVAPPNGAAPAASAPVPEAATSRPAAADGDHAEPAADSPAPHAPADSDASPAVPPPATAPAMIAEGRELPASAPAPERPEPHADDGKMGSHQSHWLASIGYRIAFVGNSGLDPFSTDDAVPQVSLAVGRTVFAGGSWSLAALALWDWGSLESTARGAKSSLTLNRITLGIEGRYHFFRRLYAFGRLAPGALSSSATLVDNVTGLDQTSASWVFAGDLSGGAAFEFAGENRGQSRRPRAWVGVEGGYGFASSAELRFKPEEGTAAPVRTQPQSFGELAVRGGFLRMAVTGTY